MVLLTWSEPARRAAWPISGLMAFGLALLSARHWRRAVPLDNATVEFLVCLAFTPVLALGVQFLLSYAGVRSRMIEGGAAGAVRGDAGEPAGGRAAAAVRHHQRVVRGSR